MTDKSAATELPQTKQCTRCLSIKPCAEFHKDNKSKDGRSTRCRSCKAEGRRQRAQEKRQGDPTPGAGSIATLILEYNEASRQKKAARRKETESPSGSAKGSSASTWSERKR